MSSVILSDILTSIRAAGDKAKAAAMETVKAKNAELPKGAKLPSLAVANFTKSSAVSKASAELIAALQSGSLVVKGAGKVLKSGDASIRIGAPLGTLESVIATAQAKALASADKRMVARFRVKFPAETEGKTDAVVLNAAKVYAAAVEQEKADKAAAAKAEAEKAKTTAERVTPEITTPSTIGALELLKMAA